MADQVLEVLPSNVSPLTFLNRLPTKRIDATITRAAETTLEEQGEQTGGYAPTYSHLSHLPLFPLYSEEQQVLLAKAQARKDRLVEQMDREDPDKVLTGGQRTLLSVLGHLSGGANVVGVKRWERRLKGAGVVTATKHMSQNKLVVFTRWTVPSTVSAMQGSRQPFFVDVFEHRFLESNYKFTSGNDVHLKVGLPAGAAKTEKVTLQLLGTEAKGVTSQKAWRRGVNSQPCEAVALFLPDGQGIALDIVARIQRACSTVEAEELRKRFSKQWIVPVVD